MSTVLHWEFPTIALPRALRDPLQHPRPRPRPGEGTLRRATGAPSAQDSRGRAVVDALAQALLEVLTGRRAAAQLARWVSQESLDALGAIARVNGWRRVRIRSTRATQAADGAVWGRITLDCDGHPVIATLALQVFPDRWRCTHLDLILPGSHLQTDELD